MEQKKISKFQGWPSGILNTEKEVVEIGAVATNFRRNWAEDKKGLKSQPR